ncbi:MAG: hypothetical protein Q7J82_01120 [Coriobacteriia bacterium]|nr:hypothetical protein [Coriobacteriia bacterium]
MSRTKILVALGVVMLALLIVGCSGPADGDGATVITKDSTQAVKQQPNADSITNEEEIRPGMREDPLPVGSTALIGDWEVTVVSVDTEADDEIANTNQFNDPPPDGYRFVLVNLEGTYVGDESGNFGVDVLWKVLGSKGNTFETYDVFAVSPNPIDDTGEAFPGAMVSGDFVIAVPIDQIDGGAIILEEMFGDSRSFFTLE